MFLKPRRQPVCVNPMPIETDEQIIANMERLKAMQVNNFRTSVAAAIDAMANRLERRNRNRS